MKTFLVVGGSSDIAQIVIKEFLDKDRTDIGKIVCLIIILKTRMNYIYPVHDDSFL